MASARGGRSRRSPDRAAFSHAAVFPGEGRDVAAEAPARRAQVSAFFQAALRRSSIVPSGGLRRRLQASNAVFNVIPARGTSACRDRRRHASSIAPRRAPAASAAGRAVRGFQLASARDHASRSVRPRGSAPTAGAAHATNAAPARKAAMERFPRSHVGERGERRTKRGRRGAGDVVKVTDVGAIASGPFWRGRRRRQRGAGGRSAGGYAKGPPGVVRQLARRF